VLCSVRETIALEDPQAFFPLLDRLTHPEWSPILTSTNDEKTYRSVLETALSSGFLSASGELASLEMAFALHAAVPRVEAAYQYYLDTQASRAGECESWVDWYGKVVCDAKTLRELVEVETIEGAEGLARNTWVICRWLTDLELTCRTAPFLLQNYCRSTTSFQHLNLHSSSRHGLRSSTPPSPLPRRPSVLFTTCCTTRRPATIHMLSMFYGTSLQRITR
jgi:hypothetical protein